MKSFEISQHNLKWFTILSYILSFYKITLKPSNNLKQPQQNQPLIEYFKLQLLWVILSIIYKNF